MHSLTCMPEETHKAADAYFLLFVVDICNYVTLSRLQTGYACSFVDYH